MINTEGLEPESGWRHTLFEVIFEADTSAGKLFDVVLIGSILLSVVAVMLDSVAAVRQDFGAELYAAEWFFTILFSIEYLLRIVCVKNTRKYLFSFYGVIDFLSIVPTYMSVIVPGTQYLLVIRSLRILRIFRVLKLVQYVDEANLLKEALRTSARKIFVFIFTVITMVIITGSLLYVVEGGENGFTSIPRSIYWAIVTLTTVGFGDIAPQTALGQALASVIMITGYGIIAVPTGIVTYDMSQVFKESNDATHCRNCSKTGHDHDAAFCKYCGTSLREPS